MKFDPLSRRDFLKLAGLGAGALALNPLMNKRSFLDAEAQQIPATNALLGRVFK